MKYFFEAQQLTAGYNGKAIVKEATFAIEKGKILTLIGPNGSGKSTILKTITRQLGAHGGAVWLDGKPLDEIRPRALSKRMAVVLTERPKPELMTCGDVVAAGRYPYTGMLGILSEDDKAQIHDALTVVGALALKDRPFSEISDGQSQRIMLARAICQQPEIIVLDEPTSFLDIRYAVDILDILRRMARERGVTVIMSLHELAYAKRVSDLVICVKSGSIACIDTPDAIFTKEIISSLYDLPAGVYEQLFGGL